MYDPGILRSQILPPLLLSLVLAFGLTGCGIEFSSNWDGTEMFKGIKLDGERVTNAPLTVTLTLAPANPAPVEIACFYEDDRDLTDDQMKVPFHDRATPAGRTVLESQPGVSPGDDVEREQLSFEFMVPEPGEYFLACMTPAAPENGLGVNFVIAQP